MRHPKLTAAVALLATSACFAAGDGPNPQVMAELAKVKFDADPSTHAATVDKLTALVKQATVAETRMDEPTEAQMKRVGFDLLNQFWQTAPAELATNQMDGIIADGKPAFLLNAAQVGKVAIVLRGVRKGTTPFADGEKLVDVYAAANPTEIMAPQLLSALAGMAPDDATQTATEDKLLATFPKSGFAGRILADRKMAEMVGKPFELTFKEFTTGKELSVQKDFKGKIIIIDFWATWCVPCVAALPELTEQYKKYKDQGVEVIGISLDQPPEKMGDQSLKGFLAKHPEMTWPQYYQGNYWDSAFSKGLGITSVPAMFVIDADGKIASTKARSKIDKLVPALIAKRDAAHS